MAAPARFVDARITVGFAPRDGAFAMREEREALTSPFNFLLTETAHAADCGCCVPRSGVSNAFRCLFLARARAELPFFSHVAVAASQEGEAAVREVVANDSLVSAWFRLI